MNLLNILNYLKDTCAINVNSLSNGEPACISMLSLISMIIVLSFIIGVLYIIFHYGEIPATEEQHFDSFDSGEPR